MAEASTSKKEYRSSNSIHDSLSKAITNKKDADIFLAELEAAIKKAREQ